MDKALEHISEQPRLQGVKEYIKLTKHDVSTISCTISHAFSAAQGTVGLMPMLRGHNQLPELLFPLARMTFWGFAKGWITEKLIATGCTNQRWWHIIAHEVFSCLGLSVNKQLAYSFFWGDATKQKPPEITFISPTHFIKNFSGLQLLSCTRCPPKFSNERQHLLPSSQKPWRIKALQYSSICLQSS